MGNTDYQKSGLKGIKGDLDITLFAGIRLDSDIEFLPYNLIIALLLDSHILGVIGFSAYQAVVYGISYKEIIVFQKERAGTYHYL
ncbi:hypothetical protein [Alkalihalobacillus sp. R86527]|uniref:hypothetical protein n=1 Tax=Alkalihalobacillus sp. R86527 TaxID=3093863 RepID=UPI00366AA69A